MSREDDYQELQALLTTEKTAIQAAVKKGLLLKEVIKLYEALGGSTDNLRRIVELIARVRTSDRLQQVDLPGPDQLWTVIKPYVIDFAGQGAGTTFRDFLDGRPLLPTRQWPEIDST